MESVALAIFFLSKLIYQFFIHSKTAFGFTTNIHIRAFFFVQNMNKIVTVIYFIVVTPNNFIRYYWFTEIFFLFIPTKSV